MFLRHLAAVIFTAWICVGIVLVAQEPAAPAKKPTATETKPPTIRVQADNLPPDNVTQWCDIYLLQGSPKDVIVFDQHGELISDARQVFLWFQIATHTPVAKIYRWPGLYRPASVTTEDWNVRSIRMVELADFQRLAEDGKADK